MSSSKYKQQQIGDPLYNCPFCVIVQRDPPWNPALSGKLYKNLLKSLQTHMGLCRNRKKADDLVNQRYHAKKNAPVAEQISSKSP